MLSKPFHRRMSRQNFRLPSQRRRSKVLTDEKGLCGTDWCPKVLCNDNRSCKLFLCPSAIPRTRQCTIRIPHSCLMVDFFCPARRRRPQFGGIDHDFMPRAWATRATGFSEAFSEYQNDRWQDVSLRGPTLAPNRTIAENRHGLPIETGGWVAYVDAAPSCGALQFLECEQLAELSQ